MTRTTLQFLELLKCGLWGMVPDINLFSGKVDWTGIYDMAERQTVVGVCFDGVLLLPKEYLPKIDIVMEWVGQVNIIEILNQKQNQGIVNVISKYNSVGLNPVLLKGQGVGQYYRIPNHRNPGDIDLYFPENIQKANSFTAQWDNVEFEEETASHLGFIWHGLSIENHHKYVKFVSRKNKKSWEMVERIIPFTSNNKLCISEFEVDVPNPQINVLYVFIHLLHHFLQVGVGLRQVCDWICIWKACEHSIDKDLFIKTVDMLPIRRSMTALTWIAENYLGIEKGIIPLDADTVQAQKDGELLLNDILETGNFGHDTEIWKNFKRNAHLNNIKSYYLALKRMIRIHRLCPSELNAYPFSWLKSKIVHF
jgi:hypothetical protein